MNLAGQSSTNEVRQPEEEKVEELREADVQAAQELEKARAIASPEQSTALAASAPALLETVNYRPGLPVADAELVEPTTVPQTNHTGDTVPTPASASPPVAAPRWFETTENRGPSVSARNGDALTAATSAGGHIDTEGRLPEDVRQQNMLGELA